MKIITKAHQMFKLQNIECDITGLAKKLSLLNN